MLRKLLIPHTSLRASEFALGTAAWGSSLGEDRAGRLYDIYRAAGGNVFDTAHVYAAWLPNGMGASERAVGKLIRQHDDRRHLVVVSKGGHPTMEGYPRPERFLSPEVIRSDVRESLERLGMETIDLYFLHRDDLRVPVGEIIELLNEEVAAGHIRYFAASNWSVARIDEANSYAENATTHSGRERMGFVANQPEYSLAKPNSPSGAYGETNQFLNPSDVAWHTRTGLPAFCYGPAAQGYFATDGKKASAAYDNATSRRRLERAKEIGKELGASPAQVALAWLRAHSFPVIPILGSGDPANLQEGLEAANLSLSPAQFAALTD